ncbi:MAG: FxDxF family PEP-CTERM protein [Alphaproteobacteria bacterium]
MKRALLALVASVAVVLWASGASAITCAGPGSLGSPPVPSSTTICNAPATGSFSDAYDFTLTQSGSVNAYTAAFQLPAFNNNITDLAVTLYKGANLIAANIVATGIALINGPSTIVTLSYSGLLANQLYTLVVTGNNHIEGSSYTGQLAFSAVPLPGSLGLFAGALGLFLALLVLRRKSQTMG